MEKKRFWCPSCEELFYEETTNCPNCKGELTNVGALFESLMDELAEYYSVMLEVYHIVDCMNRKIEKLARRYIQIKKQGLQGFEEIDSRILNFYAKLSCLVETTAAKIMGIKKDFDTFRGENDSFLPLSVMIGKITKFESKFLEQIFNLTRTLKKEVSSLNSPKKSVKKKIKKLERKKYLIRLFKINRTLNKSEKIVQIISNKNKRLVTFVTSQRLVIINSIKNNVVKEIPLSRISGLELKGWFFTKKIVICFSDQKETRIDFPPSFLSTLRESIKVGKKRERDTFEVEQRVFLPTPPQLVKRIACLFKEILEWLRKEQDLILMKKKEVENEDQVEEGREGDEKDLKEGKLYALKRTLTALEDSFEKGIVQPEYFFDKKLEIEQKISDLRE